MHQLDLALTVMGLAVVTIALLSAAIHRNPLSEPMLAMAVGVAVGPYGFGAGVAPDSGDWSHGRCPASAP